MIQKISKRLSLIVLSTILVAPCTLATPEPNESKAVKNNTAYPKLTTKDAGKNPKDKKSNKNKKESSFFGTVFKTIGVLWALDTAHDLVRDLFGNPYFIRGMAKYLCDQAGQEKYEQIRLWREIKGSALLRALQRIKSDDECYCYYEPEGPSCNEQKTATDRRVLNGLLCPLTKQEIDGLQKQGKKFAATHPNWALFLLKKYDLLLLEGLKKYKTENVGLLE